MKTLVFCILWICLEYKTLAAENTGTEKATISDDKNVDGAANEMRLYGRRMYYEDSVCKIVYHRCKNAYSKSLEIKINPILARANLIGVIKRSTGNYKLSVDITPRGTVNAYANILHFNSGTGTDCCNPGSRSPAIWFSPGNTHLYVRIGDSTNWNWGIDTSAVLPINVRTTVTLECVGTSVKLTVGKDVYTATQPSHRYVGKLLVYASDPWHPAANAEVENLRYEIMPATNDDA